jgi:fimbrial isopeptide formation D2 family protein/uncharacterized repeat protein (TIGR01451 family)
VRATATDDDRHRLGRLAIAAIVLLLITALLAPVGRARKAAAQTACTPGPAVLAPVLTPQDANVPSGSVTYGEVVKVQTTLQVACPITANLTVTQVLSSGLVWLANTSGLVGASSSSTGFGTSDTTTLQGVLTSSVAPTSNGSTLSVTIPAVTPSGTPPVNPVATITLNAQAIVAHPATGPFTDAATAGTSSQTSASLTLATPPTSYQVTKTANPATNVAAGTDVSFTITAAPVAPVNPSPAYVATITDTLPAGFTLDNANALASAVTDLSANGCAGTMSTPTLSAGVLTISWAGPVPATCTLSVSYSGTFTTSANVQATNTATVSDQSQPSPGIQTQVTGAGTTTPVVFSTGSASATVCTAAPTFSSGPVQITTDNQTDIPAPNVTVGEEVSFTATVNIPCAPTTASVEEQLSPGLVWLAASHGGKLVPQDATSSGTNLTGPTNPNPTTFMQNATVQAGNGTILQIPLGTLNPSAAGSVITLKASALVENVTTVKAGASLTDSFTLSWGSTNQPTTQATVNVVEPDLTSFAKTSTPNGPLTPGTTIDYSIAADLSATGSPAYGMVLTDGLAPDLTLQSMTDATSPAACKAADGLSLPATAPFPSNSSGGITLDPAPLPTTATGDCQLVIDYAGTFSTNAAITQTNSAMLAYQSLLSTLAKTSAATPSGTSTAPRTYTAQSQTTTEVNSATIQASYGITSGNVAVGQAVPINLNVTLPKGGASGVTVTYALPNGMAFASKNQDLAGLAVTLNGSPMSPAPAPIPLTSPAQTVTIALGKITGGAGGVPVLTLTFDAIVLDTTPAPTTLTGGGATLTFCDPSLSTCPTPNPLSSPSGSPGSLTVVSPALSESTLTSASTVQPGDPVTFTIALAHTTTSTGDAHDVTVSVPLSGWTLQAGGCKELDALGTMAPCTQDSNGNVVVHFNDQTATGAVTPAIPLTAPSLGPPAVLLTGQAEFSFMANAPGTSVPTMQVTTTWDSAASLANQGLDSPQVNTSARPHTFTTTGGDFSLGITAPSVTKTVTGPAGTGLPANDAAIGDRVTYTVAFTLPHLPGTAHGLILTDTLGAGLAFADTPAPTSACGTGPVSGSATAPALVTTSLGDFNCAFATAGATVTKPSSTTSSSTLTLSVGDVTNHDTTTADETVTFTYSAIVLDTPANVDGSQLTNSVSVSYTDDAGIKQPAASQVSTVTIVEPKLTIADVAQPLPADAGINGTALNGVRYQLTITNTAQVATGFNAVIRQDIPKGLTFDTTPALCNAGVETPPSTTSTPTPVTCTVIPGTGTTLAVVQTSAFGPLAPGASIVFSYTIDVTPGFFPGAVTLPPTTATVDWTSQSTAPVALTGLGPPGPAGSSYAKERTGPPPNTPLAIPAVDNYESSATSTVSITAAALAEQQPTPPSAPVGSEVTMSATVTLPEAFSQPTPATRHLNGFDLQATLPSGLCYESGSVTPTVASNVATGVPRDGTVNTTPCKPPTTAGATPPTPIPGPTTLDFRFGCPTVQTTLPFTSCTGETDVNPVTSPAPASPNTVTITWKVIVLNNPGTPEAPVPLSVPMTLLIDAHAPVPGTAVTVTPQEPALKVTTSWGVGEGEPNVAAPASVTIANIGTSPANNIAVTLTFTNATPPGTVTLNSPTGTCQSPPTPNAGGIGFSVGTVAPGASVICAFSPTILAPAVIAAGAKAVVAASVTTTTLSDPTDPYDRVEPAVTQQSQLLISLTTVSLSGTLTPVTNPLKPGGPASFALTITNNSPAGSPNATTNGLSIGLASTTLSGLSLSPNVGDVANSSVTSAGRLASAGRVAAASTVTWNAFTLAPGAAVTGTITGTVPPTATPGTATLTVTLTAINAINTGMTTIVGTATVQPAVDLVATIARTGPFVAGVQGAYLLQVANKGPSASGAIALTDTLPSGLIFVAASGPGWTCGAGVACSSGGLAAGATSTVTLTVLIDLPTGAQVTNAFHVSTANDVNLANNSATDQTTVQASTNVSAGHGSSVLSSTATSGTASGAASSTAAPGALAMTGLFLRKEALFAALLFGLGAVLAFSPGWRRRRRRRTRSYRATTPPAAAPPPVASLATAATTAVPITVGAVRGAVRVPLARRSAVPRLRRLLPLVGLATAIAFLLGRRLPGPGRGGRRPAS